MLTLSFFVYHFQELRRHMSWTQFLFSGKQAGEVDWNAIGGTWGSATSKLKEREPEKPLNDSLLNTIVDKISKVDIKNAYILSKYVLKFYHDMHLHIPSLFPLLNPGAEVHYVIGNSFFYGVHVNAEKPYKDLFEINGL